jgi:hypothetical protein
MVNTDSSAQRKGLPDKIYLTYDKYTDFFIQNEIL